MYKIEPVDKYKTKRIAGRIVPAIATTTAAIAGLVSKDISNIVLKGILCFWRNLKKNMDLQWNNSSAFRLFLPKIFAFLDLCKLIKLFIIIALFGEVEEL